MKRALTVYYREEDGEVVRVKFSEAFRKENPLLVADVLNDAIHDLIEIYNSTLKKGIDGVWETYKAKTNQK